MRSCSWWYLLCAPIQDHVREKYPNLRHYAKWQDFARLMFLRGSPLLKQYAVREGGREGRALDHAPYCQPAAGCKEEVTLVWIGCSAWKCTIGRDTLQRWRCSASPMQKPLGTTITPDLGRSHCVPCLTCRTSLTSTWTTSAASSASSQSTVPSSWTRHAPECCW